MSSMVPEWSKETLALVGRDYRESRADAEESRQVLVAAIVTVAAAGMGEVEIARVAGVSRMTVRKALGK